jgi:CubicO group peptidase (beta-lactamase class C family)
MQINRNKMFILVFICLIFFLPTLFLPTLGIAKSKTSHPPSISMPITGSSEDTDIAAFDAKFTAFLKKWHIPGAALSVVKDKTFLVKRGYGWSDADKTKAVEPDNLFRIASVSKTFTAVTILKLIEQKRLNLDDKVFEILDDLTPLAAGKVDPKIYQITVKNLLQMSSGWFTRGTHFDPLFGPWSGKIKTTLNPELPASCETIARYMMSTPLKHKPGTHYAYSNTDYCILGLLINKVAGLRYGYQGYEDYINQYILYPVNVNGMFIGSTQLSQKSSREVAYHKEATAASPEEPDNAFYLPYSNTELLKKNFANGGWVASAEDLAWFIASLNQKEILSPETLTFMKTKPSFREKDVTSYYTIGGQIYHDQAGREYWIQTGSFTGTNAYVITKPNGTTIAVLFNFKPFNLFSQFRPELRNMLINSNF